MAEIDGTLFRCRPASAKDVQKVLDDDLDYYAKPENYEGSNIMAMQHHMRVAQQRVSNRSPNQCPKSAAPDTKHLLSLVQSSPRYGSEWGDDEKQGSRKWSLTSSDYLPKIEMEEVNAKKACRTTESHFAPRAMSTLATSRTGNTARDLPVLPSRDNRCSRTSPGGFSHTRLSPASSISTITHLGGEEDSETSVSDVEEKEEEGQKDEDRHDSLEEQELVYLMKLNTTRLEKGRERFRHAIRTVLILLKWISSLSEKEDAEGEKTNGRTFTDIASDAFSAGEFGNSGLSFDVSQFKAKREVNISNEVKSILSTPSSMRNQEQIQTALYGLQHLKSFAEYPLHMQEKLCKVAWFQQVPSKRVIIRQGHYAENFYFILAGQAVVRILDKHPKTGEPQLRTATVMRKGTSFGELALLHHSRRTATVVSQDPVQLLAIGREDFFDIFMSGQGAGGIPDHILFACSLDFMKNWPMEKLIEHPECCLFHFFKRGVVIVKDSRDSDWLYIIKSGSCKVMKELKGVAALSIKNRKPHQERNSLKLPKLGTGEVRSKVDSGRRRRQASRTPSPIRRARTDFNDYVRKQYHGNENGIEDKENGVSDDDEEPNPVRKPQPKPKPILPEVNMEKGPGHSRSKLEFLKTKTAHFNNKSAGVQRSLSRPCSRSSRPRTPRDSATPEPEIPPEMRGPVFVQVDALKPKDCFGLTSIDFHEEVEVKTSVSLVSNGAECIMLSKKFFIEHANDRVRQALRHKIRPYPTEDTLQENLEIKVEWDLYKKKLIRDFVLSGKT